MFVYVLPVGYVNSGILCNMMDVFVVTTVEGAKLMYVTHQVKLWNSMLKIQSSLT